MAERCGYPGHMGEGGRGAVEVTKRVERSEDTNIDVGDNGQYVYQFVNRFCEHNNFRFDHRTSIFFDN